ncbi:MAG: DUF1934 domain-containing protein [Clostridiales bacterium]|nr:DUF1934 domain-containing protein [Clostridiales bacterium]
MMKKMVKITASIKSVDGVEDKIEFTTEGKFVRKDDVCIVEYEESEISGMKGSLTILKATEDKVVMIREGTGSSEMIFETGKRQESDYTTPYGIFKVEILTKSLNCEMSESGKGTIVIVYDMSIRGLSESSNYMTIEVF